MVKVYCFCFVEGLATSKGHEKTGALAGSVDCFGGSFVIIVEDLF